MTSVRTRGGTRPGSRGGRGNRIRSMDKSIMNEGVYGNMRLTHTATSLIGSRVQLQVKNGGIYEGIFKTFSPKMDIVLQSAHKVDDSSPDTKKAVPSKDMLIEKVIFNFADIVTISAVNVEVDYACKDSFTDSAISKANSNGEIKEKELTPWEADDEIGQEALDTNNDASNGWDADEMFKTNAKLGVESSFDASLAQYTIPLKAENTQEFKRREMEAARLANEIEKSDQYKASIELENGDGDEEDKFSAVVRQGGDAGSSGKYVPPHLRKTVNRGSRNSNQTGMSSPGSPSQTQPPVIGKGGKPTTPTQEVAELKVNGEKEVQKTETTERTSKSESPSYQNSQEQNKEKDLPASAKVEGRKNSNPPVMDKKLLELKEFGAKFKLDDSKMQSNVQAPTSAQPQVSSQNVSKELPVEEVKSDQVEKKDTEGEKAPESAKKSTLNPNAKEFVFNPNAKPFQPKPQQQTQHQTPPFSL